MFNPGDLVRVREARKFFTHTFKPVDLILEVIDIGYFSANTYVLLHRDEDMEYEVHPEHMELIYSV